MLLSVAYESGKTMAQPETDATKVSDIAILVITVMLFAIFVVGVASVCYRWRSRQLNSQESINEWEDSSVESRTMSARRNITVARGINADIINSFPAFLYSEVKERRIGKGGVECAVCLCEFEDNETLRLMPICCHVFHADCVSVWLSDHSTCPLCRMDLLSQLGERRDVISISDLVDYTDAHLFEGVTWTNRNIQPRSMSTRLSHCRVSEIILSRSHSTGHSVVQPVENLDRFMLRLPEDVWRQLKKKTVGHVDVASTQVRSSRRGYRRSKSDESSVFSYQRNNNYNNRRLHSLSLSGCAELWSSSGNGDVVAPLKNLPRSINSDERSFQEDERV
ncbi:RING-H2 finger protein ATL38 [Cardamine amara subsp. amara]|uniref:RING-type E3 ubiquitin transferase n=1 Tax=Cardamine amara subsp. amara TaxID=228776 RepID=A0ABD1ABB4_CARAN